MEQIAAIKYLFTYRIFNWGIGMRLIRMNRLLISLILISLSVTSCVSKDVTNETRAFKSAYYSMKIPSDWVQVEYYLDDRLVLFEDEMNQMTLEISTVNIFPEISSDETTQDFITNKIKNLPISFETCTIDDKVGYTTSLEENNKTQIFYIIGSNELVIEIKFQYQTEDHDRRINQIEQVVNSISFNNIQSFREVVDNWNIYELENLVIYYPNNSEIYYSIEDWASLRKEAFEYIIDYLGLHWEKEPIKIYVFDSMEHGKKFGLNLGFARPDKSMIFSRYMQSPGHELAHCISYRINDGHSINSALIREGLATHLDMTGKNYHMLTLKLLKDRNFSVELFGNEFRKNKDSYTLGASFVRYLIEEYGLELFIDFYSQDEYDEQNSFKQYYGKEGSTLKNEWLEYIRKLSNIIDTYGLKNDELNN